MGLGRFQGLLCIFEHSYRGCGQRWCRMIWRGCRLCCTDDLQHCMGRMQGLKPNSAKVMHTKPESWVRQQVVLVLALCVVRC
jgi:hypothetical protein